MATFYRFLLVFLLFAISVRPQSHNETTTPPSPLVEFNVTDVDFTTTKASTTVKTTTTAATSTASAVSASTPTSAPASPKPSRDVSQTPAIKVEALSSTPINCSVAVENWITSDWNTLLEKISANSSSDSFLASNFCDLKPSNYTCLNDSKLPSDRSASQRVAAIDALKKDLCNNGLKDLLALAVNGNACLVAATNVTKECLGSTKKYGSPAEYFLRANLSSPVECKNLTTANGCITSKLQNSQSCNADQQRVWVSIVHRFSPPSCDSEGPTPAPSSPKNSGSSLLAGAFLYFLPLLVLFKIDAIDV